MNIWKRLEKLEQAREGRRLEVWREVEDDQGMFHRDGVTLSRAELEARPGVRRILVLYGERQ